MRRLKRKPTSLADFLWEDYLKPMGLAPHDVAKACGISHEHMEAILYHDAPIDKAISQRLGDYFEVDQTFFFTIDHTYQAYQTKTDI